MSNQHSLIALDWLMPVLQDVFNKLTGLLQQRNEAIELPAVADALHQIAGALTLAEQKYLAKLASVLEQATLAISHEELLPQYQSDIEQSVGLLYYELRQFQQIQRLHTPWVIQRINFFNTLLGDDPIMLSPAELIDDTEALLTILPPATLELGGEQKHNLQKMWRYYTLQLLNTNQNQPEALIKLSEVAKFLTSSTLPERYRHVWYLVELWAESQLLNDEPTPHNYHHLLGSLDKLMIDDDESPLLIARIAVDVLLQLSQLINQSEAVSALLTSLHLQDNNKTKDLFKKSLSKIEQAIYHLHEPIQVIPALKLVKTLLTNRGWLLYDSYLDQILADLQTMLDNPSMATSLQWQVERQLQDLYTQLLETADTLESTIGVAQFATNPHDNKAAPQQTILRQTRVNLENIKNAFKDYTKSHDNKKLSGVDGDNVNDDFVAMVQVFALLGLEQPKTLTEQLRLIFVKIVKQSIDSLSWEATEILAQSIAQFELFLDYLSHYNLNTELLGQINASIQQANHLITQLATQPLQHADTVTARKVFEPNTPIFDDDGEKLAIPEPEPQTNVIKTSLSFDQLSAPMTDNISDTVFDSFMVDLSDESTGTTTHLLPTIGNETGTSDVSTQAQELREEISASSAIQMTEKPVETEAESEALQEARALLKPDADDTDEEIREIFIEEAEEVLENLENELPIWQANPLDLVTLKDVRRGFHTLKGSGRMVGAFQLGETAWSVENLLNRVLDGTLEVTPELTNFISDTRQKIPTLLQDYANQRAPSLDPALIILQANNLLKHRPLLAGMPTAITPEISEEVAENVALISVENPVTSEIERVENAFFDKGTAEEFGAMPTDAYSIYEASHEAELPHLAETTVDTLPELTEVASVPMPFVTTHETMVNDLSHIMILPKAVQVELDSLVWQADGEADPEIQEIYIEEAQEVLKTIAPQFDSWQKNPSDLVTLKELRRGFHTLKGSGRMVGANELGELGWAIENMLNRVLDATIEPTVGLVTLVGDVIHGFLPLIDVFAQNRTNYPAHIKVWAAIANAYSKKHGNSIDYPYFLSPVIAPSVETIAKKSADIPVEAVSENVAETITISPTTLENSPTIEVDDDELVFEDDPSEDAEDANYIGQVSTRPTTKTAVSTQSVDKQTLTSDTASGEITSLLNLQQKLDMLSDDDVIGHVFLEESAELLKKITQFIQAHRYDEQIFVSDDLVRAFHTLRGAAALSELPRVYALSAALENSLDELLRKEVPLTQEQLSLLEGAKDDLMGYIGDYKTAQAVQEQPQDVSDIAQLTSQLLDENSEKIPQAMTVTELMALGIDDLVDGELQLQSEFDNADTVVAYVKKMHTQAEILLNAVAHTKFSGLANAFRQSYADLVAYPEFCQDGAVVEAFELLHLQLTNVLDNIAAGMNIIWNETVIESVKKLLASKKYQAQLLAIEYDLPQTDMELLDIFLQEAIELDQRIHQIFTRWQSHLTNQTHIAETRDLCHALHTLKGGARLVGLNSIGDLSHSAETVYQAITAKKLDSSAEIAHIMQQVQDTISAQITLLRHDNRSFFATNLAEQLTQLVMAGHIPADMVIAVPVIVNDTYSDELDNESTSAQTIEDAQQPVARDETYSQEIINNFEQRRLDTWQGQEPDEELLAVYLEEAKELIDSSSQHLQEFRSNTSDIAALQALQRELHTIKGGARMVGAEGLANLSHEMEGIYEELGSRRKPATRMVGNLLAACHDWLASALYVLENKYNPQAPQTLIDALLKFSKSPDSLKSIPQVSLAQQVEQIEIYRTSLLQVQEEKTRDLSVMPPMSGNFETEQEQNALNVEMIRISSNLMERMINLSGESAINRARIDMGVSSLSNTIEEMGVTVQRLADQLRRMETELEVQILAQIDDERLMDTGFDPLEMDQYSSLNQLSKSLSESASDLLDFKTTLLDKTRDTENLLLQLSRTQTELQEGLMKARMVPFSRVTPRLQRIVRQTANELNKSVELRVLNDENEVDRTVLDRITPPLEHMIRNAVDHGIERTQERIESGKSRTGLITLELVREGGEIVLYLTDDGKGINVDAVRKKAIEQGLIASDDTSLTPVDIMQYIFNAGLSTSDSVTQISGRGVGMDVVQSEVKQLGGVVSVDSELSKGSRFILRLPLTVAVTDALVVKVADKQFAVPLVQIERVMRISAETIYTFHESNATIIDIDGQDYRLRYLNQVLYATNPLESVRHQTASVPVIIIRNETGQRIALQVDAIAGSRVEVVVKPLGRQLSHMAGISSATIMGDGSVMLILDLIALMRNAVHAVKTDKNKSTTSVNKPVVLIIDDSVTVRKVTTRLLERHGFEAQIAKDGIDALEVLQTLTPDIMLLDIEMPRMDGFEVANQVRHTARLKAVPIIMITSRTGEKHRERALSIGVNAYMGKPFQEQDLLENITRLLKPRTVN